MVSLSVQTSFVLADSDRLGGILRALSKSLELFGDKLYIKHTPILHQEGLRNGLMFRSITHMA